MAKKRTKSLNDIQLQSSKIKDELLRRAFSTQDMDKRTHYTKLYQQADNAAKRYQDNIEGSRSYKNGRQKEIDNSILALGALRSGDKQGSDRIMATVNRIEAQNLSRKYKGYTNAATTSSVG